MESGRSHRRLSRPARIKPTFLLLLVGLGVCPAISRSQDSTFSLRVSVQETLLNLLREEDTDGDKRITVNDFPSGTAGEGDKRYVLSGQSGQELVIVGTYHLSNLLQELAIARDAGLSVTSIDATRIIELPTIRISRQIREHYWHSLTRLIDIENLPTLLADEKLPDQQEQYLYIPPTDIRAYEYFMNRINEEPIPGVGVRLLPGTITPEYVYSLSNQHGLLMLASATDGEGTWMGLPYPVPGGRFNEMYGWDSYFQLRGLLVDGEIDLARSAVDHHVYQITHYGKILNANRTYYLTRSQPPFLTSMVLAVYEELPDGESSKDWLRRSLAAAIKEYEEVWIGEDRLDPQTDLSRYYGTGLGIPPEVEEEHYDAVFDRFASDSDLSGNELRQFYISGELSSELRTELDEFFRHDRCVRESGHDTTYRWQRDGDRCADFVTVDLNSLLFKIEVDLATTIENEFDGEINLDEDIISTSDIWYRRARERRDAIRRLLWDEDNGLFFDYDMQEASRHWYVSATAFYPLWASGSNLPDELKILSNDEAMVLVRTLLEHLEVSGGIAASSLASRGSLGRLRPARQWDYPFGWAPHQMMAWQGLINYGMNDYAQRLIYRWLYTITRNAVDHNGTIPEKFDVVQRSHQVFVEYGNVGTDFEYVTKEGFGWMNASYQVGLGLLSDELRHRLDQLTPPEEIWTATP